MRLPTLLHRLQLATLLCLPFAAGTPAHAQLNLFNGTSLLGWTPRGVWSASGGAIATNGGGERTVLTAVPFGDFDLQFEYNQSAPLGAQLRMWASHEGSGGIIIDLDTTGAKNGVGGIEGLSHSSLSTVSAGWHKVQVAASHGTVSVRIDGQPSGTASGIGAKAGYLGFHVSGAGQFSVRNVRLMPLNLTDNFNGSDLGGWKSIARSPESKGGLTHKTEKVITFGMGGGSTKPHEAKWSVKGGAIHGESGPGALEYNTPSEDAVIRLTASVKGGVKNDNFTSLTVRNTPGQLNTGYPVGIGPYAGMVEHLNKAGFGRAATPVEETIVVGGRAIATWIGGNLVSVATDSRPESADAEKGARTQAGTLQLVLPSDGSQLDVTHLSLTALAKPYGLSPRAPTPPPTPVATVTTPTTAAPAASASDSAATQALLKQQEDTQKKEAEQEATKQRVSTLMGAAMRSNDPQEQANDYSQVIQIDPANPNAMQGYKEAQAKLQQQQSASAQAANSENAEKQKTEQSNAALVSAQSAFLGGHLSEASQALNVAERLTPGNPLVRELRSRISASQSLRSRLFFLGGGMGFVALLGAIALWLRRRKLQRFPVLEVTSGIDSGKVFRIEKDDTHIGAVPQDGGQKNDIVVRDVEHAISRFHCEIVKRNGQLFVQDLNSSNGTRVDGERLKPGEAALLRKGTRIQLAGTVEMRFGYDRGAKKSA